MIYFTIKFYIMNIIIVGQGKLGTTMTKQLVSEGHDVAVIDTKREKRIKNKVCFSS